MPSENLKIGYTGKESIFTVCTLLTNSDIDQAGKHIFVLAYLYLYRYTYIDIRGQDLEDSK